MRLSVLLFATLILLMPALSGCGDASPEAPETESAGSTETTYAVRGRVVEVKPAESTIVVEHEAIEGYMAAMTMPFRALDAGELSGIAEGDAVTFEYVIDGTRMFIRNVEKLAPDAVSEHPAEDDAPEYTAPTDESGKVSA